MNVGEKTYKTGQIAKMLNLTVGAVIYLDNCGILPAHRTVTNRRYYTDSDIKRYFRLI